MKFEIEIKDYIIGFTLIIFCIPLLIFLGFNLTDLLLKSKIFTEKEVLIGFFVFVIICLLYSSGMVIIRRAVTNSSDEQKNND